MSQPMRFYECQKNTHTLKMAFALAGSFVGKEDVRLPLCVCGYIDSLNNDSLKCDVCSQWLLTTTCKTAFKSNSKTYYNVDINHISTYNGRLPIHNRPTENPCFRLDKHSNVAWLDKKYDFIQVDDLIFHNHTTHIKMIQEYRCQLKNSVCHFYCLPCFMLLRRRRRFFNHWTFLTSWALHQHI